MKTCFLVLGILLNLALNTLNKQHDIVVKSRFDKESSQALIDQIRIYFMNNGIGDPYNLEIKENIVIDLDSLLNDLPEDTQLWIKRFQELLRLQFFDSSSYVKIENLSYYVLDFNSDFRLGNYVGERLEYVTSNSIRDLQVKAAKLSFAFQFKSTQSNKPIEFLIEIENPEFVAKSLHDASLPMTWSSTLTNDSLLISLDSINIESVMKKVIEHPESIELNFTNIVIPNLSIKVGSKEIRFDEKKIKQFFFYNKEEFKRNILNMIETKYGPEFGNIIVDDPKVLELRRNQILAQDLKAVISLKEILLENKEIVHFGLQGSFCNDVSATEHRCVGGRVISYERRSSSADNFIKSMNELNFLLSESKKNIAVSVSENYLNNMIESSIKLGLWDEMLEGGNFQFGPQKVFVLAETKGESFSLYLDIIHTLSLTDRILVGKDKIRFPVKLLINLKIQEIDGIPHFKIMAKELATDREVLLKGYPQYNLESTIPNVPRFRKRVIESVLNDLKQFNDKTFIDLELQEFKGTYLKHLEFYSDGQGRGNAILDFYN